MVQSVEWIKAYAERRGQAVLLVETPGIVAALQFAGPTKRLRCRDGQRTMIAILHDPEPAAIPA